MINLSELHRVTQQFRAALEKCDRQKLPVTFERFPCGSCGDATLLLAKYLEEAGFGKFNYVLGGRDGTSHAWLENSELIIDITADQFSDVSESVIVRNRSKWHSAFGGKIQHVADLEIFDEFTRITLRKAYNEIIVHVPPNNA